MKFYFITFIILLMTTQNYYAQWVRTNSPTGRFVTFAVSDTNIFAGATNNIGGLFRSTDNGVNWTQTGLNNTNVYSLAVSDTNLFAGTLYNGVFRSTDNGTSWNPVNEGLYDHFVRALVILLDTNLFAGTYGGVFRTTNNGNWWDKCNVGLTNTYINGLVISDTNVFAGTEVGIFLSQNKGSSWIPVNNGLTYTYVMCLGASDTVLFAGMAYYGGAYRSTNNGASWTQTSLTNMAVYDFAVLDSNIFAGTDHGVFHSSNYGISWTKVNSGLTDTIVWSLAIAGKYLLAGIYNEGAVSGGIYRRPLSEIITEVKNTRNISSLNFSLMQNYPNPFNNSSVIRYSIPKSSRVILKIFNTLGEEIETLVNEEKPTGTYELTWNAAGLPSGVYFYQLKTTPVGGQAGNFVQTKKMILMK